MRELKKQRLFADGAVTALMVASLAAPAAAHHSFAMFTEEYIFTAVGQVVKFHPDASHAAIEFTVLNADRTGFVMSEAGSPVIWRVELGAAGAEARRGVTEANFRPGTVFSIYLYPARASVNISPVVSGFGSARSGLANAYLVTCPAGPDGRPILPASGQFCDAVSGARAFGAGTIPAKAVEWAVAIRRGGAVASVAEEGSPLRPCEDRPFVVLRPGSEAARAAQDEDCSVAPNVGGRAGPAAPVQGGPVR